MSADWDYIVVGGGSAGAVLAARLSEKAECRVLLLEAGGRDWLPSLHIPGFLERGIESQLYNWHYQGDPDPSLGGRQLVWAGGRVLGGSSSINGMVFGRGLPADYARWEAAGNPGWGWADMLPVFRKLEHWVGAPHQARGAFGPVHVRPFTETEAACRAVMAAFVAAGVPFVDDYSVGISEGIGLTQATQKGGWRHSAARVYVWPARRRRNLQVITGAFAERLILQAGRCAGLVYRKGGRAHHARAAREVIVAAGAISTPKLLMLSGIGAAARLAPHGINVLHDLPGVGQGLNEHVNILLSAHVDTPTYNTQGKGLAALRHGLRFLLTGAGPASSPANHVQGFIKTDPALETADIQVQLMAVGFGTEAQMKRNGITAVVSLCAPQARGEILLRSANPADKPHIRISLLQSAKDCSTLLKGARFAHAMLQQGAAQFGGEIYRPPASVVSDADWMAFIRENAGLNWHPTSTCRMGPDAAAGDVVDSHLRVHGLAGLRIADASVMPFVTSANTNVPVIAIAERAAEIIRAT